MSFFVLATLGLLCLQERYPEDLRFTILAGLTAGFTAWTKNEGALFLVALILARAWAIARYGNRPALIPQFLRLAAGLAAPLAVIVFFKLRFAPANDLVSHQPAQDRGASHRHRPLDYGAGSLCGGTIPHRNFSDRIFPAPIILLLGLYWYFLRFKVDRTGPPIARHHPRHGGYHVGRRIYDLRRLAGRSLLAAQRHPSSACFCSFGQPDCWPSS